jgi:hypothetical protein
MAVRNKFFAWQKGQWAEIAAFGDPAQQQVTRLATSPDGRWLAFVSGEP